ncbi:MAG: nucleotidyltransferase family protein [Silicimonas sp.]|nr:nucleotidyltransferase family protein [Silicimonas sp.]
MKRDALQSLTIAPDVTLRSALEAIDRSKRQIALVVDDDGRLLATVTDGDVRRGLLRGADLDGPVRAVMHENPTVVTEGAAQAETRKIIRDKRLQHVPVLDAEGRLVDLALAEELFGVAPKDTRVVLMAGGLGTRLRPLTETVPKPMLNVGGKPLLEQIIGVFADQGFWRISISVNYRAEMVRDYFGDGSDFGVSIDYIEEKQRMGTAGALSLLSEPPEGPFIVMNGDLLVTLQFADLLAYHREKSARGTLVVREYESQIPYGVVRSEDGLMTGIEEKPVERYFVNGGIYVLSPEALDHLTPGAPLDMPDLLLRLRAEGGNVGVFPLRDYWRDIGRIDDLEAARSEFDSIFRD